MNDAKPSVVALIIEPTGVRWRFVNGENGVEMQRRTRQGRWRWIMDVCSEPSNLVPTPSAALERTVENLKRRPLPRIWRRTAV